MLLAVILSSVVAQVTPPPTPPPLVVPQGAPMPSPAAVVAPAQPVPTSSPLPAVTAPAPAPVRPRGMLTLSTANVDLNPAQQRTIAVSGASLPLQATLDRKLVNVTVDPSGTSVTITATQATGGDTLHLVDANGRRADVFVRVAFNAGTIIPETTLRVTGSPVDPGWLLERVKAWVARVTEVQPGAQATVGPIVTPAQPLNAGSLTQLSVPVRISGGGRYFDQSGSTVVNVQNAGLDAFSPRVLFYDDDPELLQEDGVLFRGTVGNVPTRLYYYHTTDGSPRRIVVLLSSDSQDPTEVQIVDALAGPDPDVLNVGNDLTRSFLLTKARNDGIIVDVPQDAPFVYKDVMLHAGDDLAGAIDLRVLSGGPVGVTVLAVSPGADPIALADGPLLDGDGHARHGIFQLEGYGRDTLTYSTQGGDDADLVIGQSEPPPIPTPKNASPGHDWGDYGVTHTIDVTLSNPGVAPATAYLYFEPLGGVARASFLIDGNLYQVGCVREAVPYHVATFQLSPQQTYHATVTTMTDGGSFYPVEIGVTSTPPEEHPSIHSRDGCFPSNETSDR
jgi:hypothetical protein